MTPQRIYVRSVAFVVACVTISLLLSTLLRSGVVVVGSFEVNNNVTSSVYKFYGVIPLPDYIRLWQVFLTVGGLLFGLALEMVVSVVMQNTSETISTQDWTTFWDATEMIFPFCVGLACLFVQQSPFLLIVGTMGLFGMGCPSILGGWRVGMALLKPTVCIDALALAMHHFCTLWLMVGLALRISTPSQERMLLQCTLPLVMQHLLGLLRKRLPGPIYFCIQCVVEVAFEYSVFHLIRNFQWIDRVVGSLMLCVHWEFFAFGVYTWMREQWIDAQNKTGHVADSPIHLQVTNDIHQTRSDLAEIVHNKQQLAANGDNKTTMTTQLKRQQLKHQLQSSRVLIMLTTQASSSSSSQNDNTQSQQPQRTDDMSVV